jgi:peptidoglycan hydrolase-like protein with peptidoglycan-binding domain
MKTKIVALLVIASATLSRADQLVEKVQEALKEQGFYYGEVTGEMNANLTAAIRRYQIRNGLQVNGEINNETLRSLGINSSASGRSAAKPESASPAASARPSERSSSEIANATPAPGVEPFDQAPQETQVYPSGPLYPGSPPGAALLPGTPYEKAPLGVQRRVIVSAQMALARRGLYRGAIDGVYSAALESSLRAYQARAHLPITGRLDLGTLAALRLLPPPRESYYDPARRRFRPPPPVRGEWIPE